jgi:hypothetical protein
VIRRTMILGSIKQYPTESLAMIAVAAERQQRRAAPNARHIWRGSRSIRARADAATHFHAHALQAMDSQPYQAKVGLAPAH